MARHILRLGVLLVLLTMQTSLPPQAQVAVYDAGNFVPNNISAFQSLLTTIQTILIEANQILELTPLDNIALAADFAGTVGQLQDLMAEGQALMGDVSQAEAQINTLFSPQDVPRTGGIFAWGGALRGATAILTRLRGTLACGLPRGVLLDHRLPSLSLPCVSLSGPCRCSGCGGDSAPACIVTGGGLPSTP